MNEKILEKYLILKVIDGYGNMTRYQIWRIMRQLGFAMQSSSFYGLIKQLETDGLFTSKYDTVSTKQRHTGTWYSRTKKVLLYTLTNEGHKELLKLQTKIKTILSLANNEVGV